MPTKDELNMLYENKEDIGGFASDDYWSSTEFDNFNAWFQSFYLGNQFIYTKFNYFYVRAVRAS